MKNRTLFIHTWTRAPRRIAAHDRLVLLAIAALADEDGVCRRNYAEIAEEARVSYATVARTVPWAIKSGDLHATTVSGIKHLTFAL